MAELDEVTTTRRTPPASMAARSTFSVPSTAGTISCLCDHERSLVGNGTWGSLTASTMQGELKRGGRHPRAAPSKRLQRKMRRRGAGGECEEVDVVAAVEEAADERRADEAAGAGDHHRLPLTFLLPHSPSHLPPVWPAVSHLALSSSFH
nr:unnamed protein product [Digitaria exilis]